MSKKILLIDDDLIVVNGVKMVLEMHNYTVNTVYSAEEGIIISPAWLPDLIICDYKLPGMTGLDFAAELREHSATQSIPMILLTGFQQSYIGQMPLLVEFLMKPFEIDDLLMTIDRLLSCDVSAHS